MNRTRFFHIILATTGLTGLLLSVDGCTEDNLTEINAYYSVSVPPHFPALPYPDDNPMLPERIDLGRELFFDPILSVDSSVSCMSCHKPEWAFADHAPISAGIEGRLGFRNAPTLANVAWAPVMLMDGGSPTLEQQVYVPLEDVHEMAFNMVLLTERLSANAYYRQRFQSVFGTAPDPYGITRALAAYQRSIISGNSRFDRYMRKEKGATLTESEERGKALFFSDALSCSSCHNGFHFTTWEFINNGLYADYGLDSGRALITAQADDVGKFRVPTLRNIAVTYPYMHDGSLPNLEAVIEHYNSGGMGHPNQDARTKPLGLTAEQKSDLVHFLNTLTDKQFLNNTSLVE